MRLSLTARLQSWPIHRFVLCFFIMLAIIVTWGPSKLALLTSQPFPEDTQRKAFISLTVDEMSRATNLNLTPVVRLGDKTSAVSSIFGPAIIEIESDLLNEDLFSDDDIRVIIGHEVGHIARHDTYRFWTKFRRTWGEEREFSADHWAGRLAGCSAFKDLVARNIEKFERAHANSRDPHGAPSQRIKAACSNS